MIGTGRKSIIYGLRPYFMHRGAEGNTFNDNISRVHCRSMDEHIRSYVRIPDGYRY